MGIGIKQGVLFKITKGIIKYFIRYNANGGSGTMQDQEHTVGQSKALTANAFTKANCTFTGWTGQNGISYTNGAIVKDLLKKNKAIFTMTAKWATVPLTYLSGSVRPSVTAEHWSLVAGGTSGVPGGSAFYTSEGLNIRATTNTVIGDVYLAGAPNLTNYTKAAITFEVTRAFWSMNGTTCGISVSIGSVSTVLHQFTYWASVNNKDSTTDTITTNLDISALSGNQTVIITWGRGGGDVLIRSIVIS